MSQWRQSREDAPRDWDALTRPTGTRTFPSGPGTDYWSHLSQQIRRIVGRMLWPYTLM